MFFVLPLKLDSVYVVATEMPIGVFVSMNNREQQKPKQRQKWMKFSSSLSHQLISFNLALNLWHTIALKLMPSQEAPKVCLYLGRLEG